MNSRLENLPLDILGIWQQEQVIAQISKIPEINQGTKENTTSTQQTEESMSTSKLDKIWEHFNKIVNTESQETHTSSPKETLKIPEIAKKVPLTIESSDKVVKTNDL